MPRKKQTTFAKTYVYHGHQYRVKGATKKEAEAKLRKLIAELEAGEYRKSKELTLDQYHEIWEDSRHGTVSENTIRKQKFEYANISNTTIDRNGNRFGDLIIRVFLSFKVLSDLSGSAHPACEIRARGFERRFFVVLFFILH